MNELEDLLALNKSQGIYIDIGTQIHLEIDGVTFSVTSTFVGFLKHEFMIITLPKKYNTVKNKLYKGNKMIVKYLYKGSVYVFQTGIIEIITTPIQALAIEYPKVVQQMELREIKRRQVVIPGKIEVRKKNFPILVNDISKKGCQLIFQKKTNMKEGDLVKIYCKFPGFADEVGTMARVRNIRRGQKKISIGAEFQDATQIFLTPLMQFLISIEGML